MRIVKELQWDMGHRVTNHKSQCKNLHGHRYKMEICLTGNLIINKGTSEEGMVIDYSKIKNIATRYVKDVLDHSFMLWEKDKILVKFFKQNKDLKHLVVPFVPTCENIAAWIFLTLDPRFKDTYKTGLELDSITVWETPTSLAICERKDVALHGSH